MSKAARKLLSAGLLLYRIRDGALEVFLAHPGGPFWKNRDTGAWTIPKGLVEKGEDLFQAACREFQEETGIAPTGSFYALGSIKQKAGKIVHAWAWEGDADPAQVQSNPAIVPSSTTVGKRASFPEIDRCAWFGIDIAREKINPAQAELIDRLRAIIQWTLCSQVEDNERGTVA